MWDKGFQVDEFFEELYRSFWRGDKTFPFQYAHWKISLGECSLDPRGVLQFRNCWSGWSEQEDGEEDVCKRVYCCCCSIYLLSKDWMKE
jgi:hypothetical protein